MSMSPEQFKALRLPFMPPVWIEMPRQTATSIQQARDLGQYGYNLLDQISKDYARQVDREWKPAFNEVVSAFATAVEQRNNTLKIAEAEKAEQAAFNAFIFSLLTAGAMKFVGAYVEHAFLPRFKVVKSYSWDFSKGIMVVPKANANYTARFSELQRAAFGGIAEDIATRAAGVFLPQPTQASYDLALWSGVINLLTDLNNSIDATAKAVLEQFSLIQTWMNNETEFGAAWVNSHGSVEMARANIRLQIDKLRKKWADKWVFFGKNPVSVARTLLADHYERTLWAGYLGGQFATTLFPDNLAEKAVVNRLKHLNVVWAETMKGFAEQTERVSNGSPQPTMHIEGSIDNIKEGMRRRFG